MKVQVTPIVKTKTISDLDVSYCVNDVLMTLSHLGLADPGETVGPGASLFLETINNSPVSIPFICKPTDTKLIP